MNFRKNWFPGSGSRMPRSRRRFLWCRLKFLSAHHPPLISPPSVFDYTYCKLCLLPVYYSSAGLPLGATWAARVWGFFVGGGFLAIKGREAFVRCVLLSLPIVIPIFVRSLRQRRAGEERGVACLPRSLAAVWLFGQSLWHSWFCAAVSDKIEY